MPRPILVIPGDDPPQLQGSPHLERLRQYGEVRLYPDRPATHAEKLARVRGATCLINSRGSLRWPAEILRELPDLKLFAVVGIGTDAIDLAVARELGIAVCNLPGRTAPVVAEHALALLLAVARKVPLHTAEVKQHRWAIHDGVYLHGKMLGLVGAGSIAVALARLARGIGMRVQAWTLHPTAERSQQLGIDFVDLPTLLATSDAVSLHLPLTPQSRGLLGEKELALMKPGALLVNTARGAIVDSTALVAALNSGRLGGAGLDVFDKEPLPEGHPLLACANVALTPHSADQTPEGMEMLNGGVVDNVIAWLEGRPQNLVR